jgi:glucosyl-3-phosphoglycerate synthase
MPDFHQPILLPTLHHLADTDLEEREGMLKRLAKEKPVALVIPALFAEIGRTALPRMLKQLSAVPYVSHVIFSMNDMSAREHDKARRFFARRLAAVPHTVLWNDGPQLDVIHQEVAKLTGSKRVHGKGSNVWMGIAHLLANGHTGVVACHDSDILNYDREMLWRLCLPVAHPEMDYVFAKSYYGRVRGRMYGRVTRLLVFPLLQALREVFGSTPLLRFLAMTRYPLSGEFAADAQFLGRMGLAADWGLEIGMLCDVFRHTPAQRFCQVDLGGNFDHKHQHLGYDAEGSPDPGSGLAKMAREVTRAIMAHLWNDLGFSAEPRKLERLADTYLATAQVLLTRYKHEALFNGLESVTAEEKSTVKAFAGIIRQVSGESLATRPASAVLPSWESVLEKLPVVAASLRISAR